MKTIVLVTHPIEASAIAKGYGKGVGVEGMAIFLVVALIAGLISKLFSEG